MILTRSALEALVRADRQPPVVSLYAEGSTAGEDWRGGRIRLKNLLGACEEDLRATGASTAARGAVLAPARQLLDDDFFWHTPSPGLAIFLDGGDRQVFRLPYRVDTRCIVDERPFIRPLLPAVTDPDGVALALSRNRVRLLEHRDEDLRVVEVPGMPGSLTDALGEQVEPGSLQQHGDVFHGQGAGEDDRGVELERFLQAVWRPLRGFLTGREAPVIVVSVERDFAALRQVAHQDPLLVEHVDGNPDQMTESEIAARIAPAEARLRAGAQDAALSRLDEQHRRALTDLPSILSAAEQGRIETLFVARETAPDDGDGGDSRSLDAAAARTIGVGGTVRVVDRARLPGQAAVAALLRG